MGFYDTQLTEWPAPRWLVCLTGRGAAQVSQVSFCNCISCIYNFDEVFHLISKHNSQQVLAFSRRQFEKVGLVFLVSFPFVFSLSFSQAENERF